MKDFKSQSLAKQAKKGEELVFLMLSSKKSFVLMGDDLVELCTEKEVLGNKQCDNDEKWLEASKAKLLKQIDDERTAKFFRTRMDE